MATRNQTADLLKGIAVLLMIQVHIIELFASNAISNSSLGKILLFLGGAPVAPVFAVIFGYFIAASKKSSTQLILKGFKFIGLGFFLNIALNLNLIISVAKGLYQIDILPYIFGVDILHFAGVSLIFIAIFKTPIDRNLIFLIMCIITSPLLGHLLLNHVPKNIVLEYMSSLFYGSSNWSYFPLFPWLSYPLTGIACYRLIQRHDFRALCATKIKIWVAILWVLFFVLTINYAISISSDLPSYYHHGIVFFIWVILFLLGYSFYANKLDELMGETILLRYIKWLGKHVTIIYFIQWIIIGNIATEIYKTVLLPSTLLIYFVSIVFISSCFCYSVLWVKQYSVKK